MSDTPTYATYNIAEPVDEWLALVNGPPRIVGQGHISPPLSDEMLAILGEGAFKSFLLAAGTNSTLEEK